MAEVWGTEPAIETARTKLKALLDALVTATATGYDPKVAYAYSTHVVSLQRVPSVTIGYETGEMDERGRAVAQFTMHFSIRVHVDYKGGFNDELKESRLLNSVINKLKVNNSLGDQYHLTGVSNIRTGQTFADSATLGGQLTATITKTIAFTQE